MSSPSSPPPPPRRYTSPTGRIVIPVLFVVLLIVVLGRPILVSGLNLDPDVSEPVATPGGDDKKEGSAGPTRLANPYPKGCLAEVPSPRAMLIAASAGGTVAAGMPTGESWFSLQARPPVGFSASGSFLATAGADLWTLAGDHVGVAFRRPVQKWAWSPIADCIAGIDGGRLAVALPDRPPVVLIDEADVSTFAFSPDGSRIVLAVPRGPSSGLWLADLPSGDVRVLQRSTGWTLAGWTPQGKPILLDEGALGTSVPRAGLAFPPSDVASQCGDDVMTAFNGRLANLAATGSSGEISHDPSFVYSSVGCAPGGQFLIAIGHEGNPRDTTMVILRRDGTLVEEVAQQSRVEDAPMWGPPHTGVLFAADVGGEGAVGPLVWFLPEGGTARPTGLRVDRLGASLDALLDWSATPPLGNPTD